MVWDPNATKTISVEDHNLKTDSNVFNGVTVHGIPDSVVISGRIAIDEGTFIYYVSTFIAQNLI